MGRRDVDADLEAMERGTRAGPRNIAAQAWVLAGGTVLAFLAVAKLEVVLLESVGIIHFVGIFRGLSPLRQLVGGADLPQNARYGAVVFNKAGVLLVWVALAAGRICSGDRV
jgi:hypothetical protein